MINPNDPTANAQQTFNDNFQSTSLSLTNPNGSNGVWNTDYSYNTPNDPNAKNYLPSNAEQEWYLSNIESQPGGRTAGIASPFSQNSTTGLTIQATPTPSGDLSKVGNQPYLSGELNTQGTFSQEYGLYEEKAQIPSGQGLWPAFWLLPENGQWPPELDVMESIGNNSQFATTIHASSLPNGYENDGWQSVPNPGGFNTFAMDWEPDYTTFYVDGKEVYQAPTPKDIDLPMYLLTNLAVGGSFPGSPNSSTHFPADFNIADIQVYQSKANLAAGYTPQGSASYYGVSSGSSSGSGSGSGSTGSGTGTSGSTASHDYLGDGHSQILIEATNGAVDIGNLGSNGQLSYTQVSAIGSAWTIGGSGDFLGQGHDQYMLENANGALDIGSVSNGQATYTQVGAIGSEWTMSGTGTYLGASTSDFLLLNKNGAVDVGAVGSNGQATYTQVASIGSEWKIAASGDFLGNGHDQFLLQNSNGALDVGNVVNGQAQFTQVSAIGSAWTVEGAGDFLGDGKSQLLLYNTNGAVDIGEVGSNGQMTYTQVASIGSEWKFVGTGDVQGQGHAQFVLENSNGAVDVGNVVSGHAQFTQVGALGSEWHFHM
jgi:beta-glucanase (GH16 family)